MRQPLVIANWKMNKTASEAQDYCSCFRELLGGETATEVAICPPFTALESVGQSLVGTAVKLGAQNFYPKPNGAYTGEVSIGMLKSMGCSFVIVGHSERRSHFGETAETISEKVKVALDNGVTPILCVGETMSEKSLGLTQKVIGQQLLTCLKHVASQDLHKVVIAYEPLWAIGSGRAATVTDAALVADYARQKLQRLLDGNSEAIRVLYGGSVTVDNIKSFAASRSVDGALVGGASLDPEKFAAIVKAYEVKS